MIYVEWLRVRNVARVTAIVLGVFLLVALVLRIGLNSKLDITNQVVNQFGSGTSTKTTQMLPNGIERTILRDSDGSSLTMDAYPDGNHHIVITEPASRHHSDDDNNFIAGSVHVQSTPHGKFVTTVIDTNGSAPFEFYLMLADVVALIVSTLLAAPLARERDGHLEFALTKPISRTAYSIGAMSVDLAGILICMVMAIVAMIIAQAMFEVPHVDFTASNPAIVLASVLFPFTWYAFVCGLTASVPRNYGAVLGFVWPASIVIVLLASLTMSDTLLGRAVHDIAWPISRIIPLSYMYLGGHTDPVTGQLLPDPVRLINLAISFVLFLIYSALAVFQWRRVEA